MTLDENTFPIGYFYILSKMNGMALGVDPTKEVGVKYTICAKKKAPTHRQSLLIRVSIYFIYRKVLLSLPSLRQKRSHRETLNSGCIKQVSKLLCPPFFIITEIILIHFFRK
jgi:hypothetical protein